MRVSMYMILLIAGLLMVFGCSDSSSGDDGESNGDTTVVGLWNITSYSDEDGASEYTGWLEYASNGTFDSSLKDEDYPYAFEVSGTWSTSGSSLTLVVQESNDPWLPAGTYVWSYSISNNTLTMSITLDGDTIQMTFDKDTTAQTGTISGTVTEADRGPLAGVLVTVLTASKTATTGSDGTYTITDVPIGSYSVMFTRDGYATETKTGVQVVENQTATVNAQMTEAGDEMYLVGAWDVHSFMVNGVDNETMDGMLNLNEDESFGWSLEEVGGRDSYSLSGTWSLDGDHLLMEVAQSDYTPFPTGSQDWIYTVYGVTLSMESTIEELQYDLSFVKDSSISGTLMGTITDETSGDPVEGVIVNLLNTGIMGETNLDGNYAINDIPIGYYSVEAVKLNYVTQTVDMVQIEQGVSTELDFELTSEGGEGNGSIEGYVRNGNTQAPIENATVVISGTSFETTTSADGYYIFSDVPAGTYDMLASKTDYNPDSDEVEVYNGVTSEMDFDLFPSGGEDTGSMEGFVADVSNQTVLAGATITIEGTSLSGTSDALGYYHIGNIPAGDYTAVCSKAGYQSDDAYVTIIAGDVTDVDFIMIEEGNEPYAILAGTITASGYGTPIDNVVVTIGEAGVGASDETGAYEAMVLTAGTYDVTFRRTGFEPYTASGVTFTIGETVDLDVEMTLYEEESTNTLQVYVSKEDLTPISGATVTLQGTSFTGTTSFLGFCTFDNVPVGAYRMDVEKSGYQSVEGRTIYVYSHQGTPAAVNVILEPGR